MHRQKHLLALGLTLAATLSACSEPDTPVAIERTGSAYIVAVNKPLQYIASRLLEDDIEVILPAPAGTDPANWTPEANEILQLQQAELVLLNGAGYSSWKNKVALPDRKMVVSAEAARDNWIALEDQVTHSHGPEGDHAHSGYAVTTWMDMDITALQAKRIAEALQASWPESQAGIQQRLDTLLEDLQALDAGFTRAAAALSNRAVIYSHPVYQYFERRYRLPGISLHWEPDQMPDEGQWRELEALVNEQTLFIWEGAPNKAIDARLTQLGIEWLVLDPAAGQNAKDWLSIQQDNLDSLLGR